MSVYRTEVKVIAPDARVEVLIYRADDNAPPPGWHATERDAKREAADLLRLIGTQCYREAEGLMRPYKERT